MRQEETAHFSRLFFLVTYRNTTSITNINMMRLG
jgi:hypothetical protein